MRSAEDYKKYGGTKLIYGLLNNRGHPRSRQRQPIFLQRNIRQILDAHERDLNSLHSQATTNHHTAGENTGMKARNAPSRTLPSVEMLADAVRDSPQLIRIHPKRLLRRSSSVANAGKLEDLIVKKQSADPSWLPNSDHIQMRCNISCRISIEEPDSKSSARILYTEARLATLVGIKDAQGDLAFLIDMKDPFVISANQLLATRLTTRSTNKGKKWNKSVMHNAMLNIGINCFNSDDALELLYALDPDIGLHQDIPPDHTELRAVWKNLASCADHPPTLRRYVGGSDSEIHRSKKLEYCLDADVSWTSKARDTPLAMCNHVISAEKQRKYSLPNILEEKDSETPQDCHITYIFDGGSPGLSRRTIETSLNCVLCPGRLPHRSFDLLHLHYLSCHDHFTFTVSAVAPPPDADSSLLIRLVKLELAVPERERASDSLSDNREITWIKPERPFDIQQYLSEGGGNSWASGKPVNSKRPVKTLLASPSFLHESINGQDKGAFFDHQHLFSDQHDIVPPEQVQDLPPKKRKSFKVPNIKGVAIYRSKSKRRVEPGEVLSESDEEMDCSWLQLKHNAEDFPKFGGPGREFIRLFDNHLMRERIPANIFLGDAVVRFTRAHVELLLQPELFDHFATKLRSLLQQKLISEDYLRYCLELVAERAMKAGTNQASNTVAPTNNHEIKKETPSTEDRGPIETLTNIDQEDVIMIDDSDTEAGAEVSLAMPPSSRHSSSPIRVATNGTSNASKDVKQVPLSSGACPKCARPAFGVRGIICCANPDCPFAEFHMSCMGLTVREPGWLCEECRSTTLLDPVA